MSSRSVDRGLSSTFSEILIVAVVVASVTLVGTFVLANAQNDVSETETRLLDATVEVDGEIALSHRGGESIPTSELRLIVRNDSGTVYETAFTAGVLDGADDGSFDVGDTARFDDAGLPNGDIRVLIVHDPTGKLLETQRFFGTSFVAGLRSASITNAPIGTADTGTSQTVTLQFSDEMGVPPTVKITGLNRTYDVAPKDGGFQSATTWTGEVTIRDDEEETTARIEVSGAVDATGRSLSTRSSTFDVDTVVPTVTVDQPNGGETIQGGSTYRIEWTANDGGTGVASNSVRLEYSTDGGSSWTTIATDEADDGAYDWSVPAIDSSSVRVRVNATDVAGNTGSDASDSAFTVDSTPPTVTVNQPNGGETLQGGSTYTIEWTASDAGTGVASNSVGLAYSTDSGSSWTTIATDEADDRAYNWSVPTIDSSTVRVRVNATDVAGNVGSDTSDGDLTITSTAPSVTGASIAGAPINVSETGTTRTVTVNFDQPMDTNVPPTVEVRELPNSNDLPVSANPGYVDDTTWKGNVTIPENQDESNARIYVADAESVVGIEMTPDDSNTFYVDTRRPLDPDMATVLTNPINVSNENNVAVEVAFSSPPEAGTVYVQLSDGNGKTVVASGPADTSSSTTTVTGVDVSSLADTPAGATESISATAKIVDAYGNPNNDGGTFTAQDNSVLKDTVKPTVDTVDVSPSPVTNDSRTVTIDITFSERMEQNVDPTVTLTGLDQTYTVTGSQTNRGQSGSAWRGTVTINEDVEGTATVEITDALDEGLNGMDPDTSTTFAVDTRTPVISNFAATATGQAVEISFESDQQLATVSVDVNDDGGNNEETLTRTDFTESGTGPYTYNATFTASEDDTYDATLDAAADGVGNDGASGQTASVVVDSTPPSVSGVAITDDTDGDGIVTDGDAVQVTATVTDTNGITSVTADASAFGAGTVTLADDGPNSGSGDDQYSATFTVGSGGTDGDRSAAVSAADEYGNGGSQAVASGTLVVDTTAPSALSIDAPASEAFRQSDATLDITYSYDEANSDSVTLTLADGSGNTATYTIDDTGYAGDDTGRTVTLDLASPDSTAGSGLVGGSTYDVQVSATDAVGQSSSTTGADLVTVDDTAPSVSGVAITDDTDGDGIVTDGDAVQVTATVTDANGVASVTADASAFGAGSVSLADDGPNSGSGDDQYSATFTVGSSPGDGTRSVTVSATDEAGNGGAQAVQSGTLVVDTTAPSALSIDAPTAETFRQSGESVDVTYSYTDANPDSVTIILADGSGNRGTYTIDDTDYAGDDTGKTVTFDLASPDSTDGSGLVDGATYDITVSATDAVGQSTSTTGANLVTIDDTPPTLDGASRVDDTTINVTVSDATTGLDTTSIEKADFYVDVGSIASIDTSGISDGDTTGTVTVNLASAVDSDTVIVGIGGGAGGLTDLVGNAQRTDSAIVSGMDGVAPTFDAASKINTSAIKIVLGDGVGVDESTIAAGDFALNGSATLANVSVTENGTGADVVLRFDPVDQKNIQVDITSAIDDTSGNSLGSGSKVVSDMDGVAPTITGPNPADGATLSDASPTYTVDVTDAGVGVDLSTLRVTVTDSSGTVLDNVGTGDGAVSFSDGTLTIDGPAYADGQVDVTVDADDNAGNAAPQFTSTFTVDTTAPTVTSITRDSPGSTVTNGDSVTFAVAFSESVAGIDTADFDVNTGGSVSASITGVSASSGTSVDVTMSSITGDGSLGLNVASGTDITDDAGNTLDSIEPPTDEIYTIDNTGPTITGVSVSDTIDPDGTAGDGVVNDGDTVRVEATVTDANGVDSVTVDAAAFGAGTVTLTNANGDDVYDAEFAVDAVAASGDGTYQLTVSTTDSVGNANAAQTGGVELDTRAPTISTFDATNPSGKDIKVTIESDEPLSDINVTISKNNNPETTFTEGDFSETGSGPYTYTATYSNNQGGTFTATLNIAEDETGNNGGAGQTSTVSPSGGGGNKAPTADAGSDFSVTEGSTGTLDGSASSSDPSRSITTYEWTITNVNGLSVSINDADTSDPTAVFDATGASVSSPTDVTVELKVTDNEGDTATDTVVVTVIDSGSAATQVSQNGSASQGGEGELVFSLENTGSSTVSITDIQINSFNKNTGNVNIERVNRGGDEFRADSSGKLDQKMDIGISYALDSNADIGDKNTVEFTLGNFQEQSGNSGNYKDVDISGSTIEITIYYADGSSETFSFTP